MENLILFAVVIGDMLHPTGDHLLKTDQIGINTVDDLFQPRRPLIKAMAIGIIGASNVKGYYFHFSSLLLEITPAAAAAGTGLAGDKASDVAIIVVAHQSILREKAHNFGHRCKEFFFHVGIPFLCFGGNAA